MDLATVINRAVNMLSQPSISFLQSQFYFQLEQDNHEVNGVEGFLQKLNNQKTNVERVDSVYEKLEKYDMLKDKYRKDGKNDNKALRSKEKGNKFFCKGKYPEALKAYTKTLMKAETQEVISIAYANRSAALFKLGLFKACSEDIDRALANNYPEILTTKLLSRKNKSQQLLRKSLEVDDYYENPPQIPTSQKNSTIDCFSNSIEIKNDKSRQRITATRDIQVGDVVAVESPFAATIGEVHLYHCHNCFELCYNPIPCNSCTQVLYCSDSCKNNKYHKHECGILLSLRKLVGKNTNFLLATKMSLLDDHSEDVLKLSDTLDESKDSSDDKLKFSLVAACFFYLLKNYTERFDAPNLPESTFKDYVVKYIRICIAQATGVDELCQNIFDGEITQETVASGIYPFYSLFRHSCCPNVFVQHHGLKRVLRAIRTIKKGQECLVSYGPHYVDDDKEERHHRLFTQFRFKCSCRACRENWPQLINFPHLPSDEDLLLAVQIDLTEIDLAKQTIPRKIRKVRQLERFEPRADLTLQQQLLLRCYDVLGNKRLIP